ncbi:MAG: hypothetical protein ABEJ80_01310 [Halarchaeum sp.]
MKKTPTGTSVGVDDPYEHAGPCDHVTGDGKCRYAFDHPEHDPEFADRRASDDYRCPAADGDWAWRDCPHYRSKSDAKACARCGLEERRNAHTDARPLLEEHHLEYAGPTGGRARDDASGSESERHVSHAGPTGGRARDDEDDEDVGHEITVVLCRWCHSAVHDSWARIDDDANPSPEALAAAEGRRSEELDELGFETAATRRESE